MKVKISLLALLLTGVLGLKAQMSGTYTIGGSGTYSSFSAAVSALNSQGISGDVTFNVASGTYTENITINNFTGNGSHKVTFKSANNDSTAVVLQYASGTSTSNNFVVKFNGAKNIVFKYMTIKRTGSNSFSKVIDISNSSSNLYFESVILKNNSTSSADEAAGLVIGKNINNSVLNNFFFDRCKFQNGSYGIFMQGVSSGVVADSLWITNSIFDGQYRLFIYAAYQKSPIINDNIFSTTSSYSNFHGIEFLYCKTGPQIRRNYFNINKGTALYLTNSQGCCSFTGEIFNNFLSLSGSGARAFFFSNTGTFHVYFNSINLHGSSQKGFEITGSTSNHNRFANNILYSNTAAKLMIVSNSIAVPFDYCNYNDYKTTGYIGDWHGSTNISSLNAWKTASSLDASSISVNPNFVSNTDLHIQNSQVQRAGTSALNAPTTQIDYDGNTRHYLKPDMGAHEYSYDDMAITHINVQEKMCLSSHYSVKITLKNLSNHTIDISNLPVNYSFNGNTVSELKPVSNLAAGDSIDYIFNGKITASTTGNFDVKAWFSLSGDVNLSNDSITKNVMVNDYPVITLPNDTTVCSTNSVTLDPGQGFDNYLWSTNDTTSTLTVTYPMLGMGGTFVWVEVTKDNCKSKDSTLVVFVDCTGYDEIAENEQVKIFPNPVKNSINIDMENSSDVERVEIIDLSGKVLFRKDNFTGKIDVSSLQKGIYYLILSTGKGTLKQVFIKN